MQRLKHILATVAMLIACVGCGGTSTKGRQTPVPAATAALLAGAPMSSTRTNDNDAAVIYSKGNNSTRDWRYFRPSKEDFKQDEHSSNFVRGGGAIPGVGVVVNFNGTGITWIGKKGPQYGKASYSIDGGPPQTVGGNSTTCPGEWA